jgi:1-acyl-sn-glycerol-3-phosphate acyltransferase
VRVFVLRLVTYLLAHLVYRVRVTGLEHIPSTGAAILVSNHVTFVDWLLITAAIPRPVRFVMHHSYYRMPILHWLFRSAKVIPIAGSKEDPALLEAAFERVHEELADGQLVCLFPEGRITDTGEMSPFRPGIERILARDPVPVVPIALDGLWGSFFSRKDGPAMTRPFRRVWSIVQVRIGEEVAAEEATAVALQRRVGELLTG